jgi:hypothetical protein
MDMIKRNGGMENDKRKGAPPASVRHFDLLGFAGKSVDEIRGEVRGRLEREARLDAEAEAAAKPHVRVNPHNIQAAVAKWGWETINPGGGSPPPEDWLALTIAGRYFWEARLRVALRTWEGLVATEAILERELNPNAEALSQDAIEGIVEAERRKLLADEGKDLNARLLQRMEETKADARAAFQRGNSMIFDAQSNDAEKVGKLLKLCQSNQKWQKTMAVVLQDRYGTQEAWAGKLGIGQSTLNERLKRMEEAWKRLYPDDPPLLLRRPLQKHTKTREQFDRDGATPPAPVDEEAAAGDWYGDGMVDADIYFDERPGDTAGG